LPNYFGRQLKLTIDDDFVIENLRVDFTVEKSLVGYASLAKITVYNLIKENRERIKDKGQQVKLYAGYDDLPLLFSGDLVNVIHVYEKPDWKTEIYAGDKADILRRAVINKSLPADTTPQQLMDELVGAMDGVTKGIMDGLTNCLNNKRSLLRSIQLAGNVGDFLDELAKNCGFDYAIADGIIDTSPTESAISDVPVVLINQLTGMIGAPERTADGVEVKTFLNPALRLGRAIEIEAASNKINAGNLQFRDAPTPATEGQFKVIKMVHEGSLWSNKWETSISGTLLKNG